MTGRFATDEVQRYYDRHTDRFVAYGQGGAYGAIHRAVWGPGTRSRSDAFRYVESQIGALGETLQRYRTKPVYCLPFMQPGRLVRVVDGEEDW